MNTKVCSKIPALGERTVALVAFVRLFTSMSSHMDLESARSHEFVITGFTNVGSLTRMSSFMVSEVTLRSEMHITICKITFKRSLTIMNSHMRE
jgi:fluoride ion exporter CrcB/FEX